MTELLTAAQMRAIEKAAIDSGEVTGLELMERAGAGVVEAILKEWPQMAEGSLRAVVLCGPGNNGGDGFVVARLLKARGWEVEVFLYGTPEKMPPDARVNHERWLEVGKVAELTRRTFRASHPVHGYAYADIYIDAIFGTGLSRPPEGDMAGLLRHLGGGGGDTYPRLVAVDAPSGLCLDSGRCLNGAPDSQPNAALTVTFERPKLGHFLADGPEVCGKLVVTPIGLERFRNARAGLPSGHLSGSAVDAAKPGLPSLFLIKRASEPVSIPFDFECLMDVSSDRLQKSVSSGGHKFSHGHALILSGDHGQAGAARLSARAALRIGAGLVTLASPPGAMAENAARLDAVMLKPVADAAGLTEVLGDTRISALCLGPGLGVARAAALLAVALGGDGPPPPAPPHAGEGRREDAGLGSAEGGPRSLGLGAALGVGGRQPGFVPGNGQARLGGATLGKTTEASGTGAETKALPLPLVGRGEGWGAIAVKRPNVLDADALTALSRDPTLFALLHNGCILTPHGGEFARLFPDIAAKLAAPAVKGPAYSKVDATREAAVRAGCVVLFKGPDTVIAEPDGRCAVNAAIYERAAPWLATAGSGDVLAGFITGLLARGFSPFDAACTGAWLHVECARSFGPGLIAEDLAEELPKVFRRLGM